jgi:hypothetical protein
MNRRSFAKTVTASGCLARVIGGGSIAPTNDLRCERFDFDCLLGQEEVDSRVLEI